MKQKITLKHFALILVFILFFQILGIISPFILEVMAEQEMEQNTMVALRENGKIYIYSNYNNNTVQYSLTGTEFKEYTEAFENEDAKKIFIKIGKNQPEEVEVQELDKIYDIETKRDIFDDAYRENGIVNASMPKVTGALSNLEERQVWYSFDKVTWNKIDNTVSTIQVKNIDADIIYIKQEGKSINGNDDFGNIMYYNIYNVSNNKMSEILGVYEEDNSSYIFGQDRTYSKQINSKERYKYTIIDDDNDIQSVDSKVLGLTTLMGEAFILKQDGIVYKVGESYNDLQKVEGSNNFTQISGKFAVTEDNSISYIEYNYDDNTYKYVNTSNYNTTERKIKKILSIINNGEACPYVLYTNGEAEILHKNADATLVANNVIDIAVDNEVYYALQADKVICNDGISNDTVDISYLFNNNELAIKINNYGAILTNKGNYYEMECAYSDAIGSGLELKNDKLLKVIKSEEDGIIPYYVTDVPLKQGYDKVAEITRTYSLETSTKSNVKTIGNYTYQNKEGTLFYRSKQKVYNYDDECYDTKIEESKIYKKTENNITISKDESKLDQNEVIINIQVPTNTYTVKKPDGTTTNTDNVNYVVNKNGEYVFEFTDSDGNKIMRTVHVTTIQNRKETKVPEVTALNGNIILESDDEIEYSLDKNNWNLYTKEIEYKDPIYARIKNDEYECSILKITINTEGHLNVQNTEKRILQDKILTNSIGTGYTKTIKYENKVDEQENDQETEEKKGLFNYISQIADNIIYTFSSTDGKYAGCYFEDNITEITYKDMYNDIVNIDGENYNIKEDINIEYSVVYEEYQVVSYEDNTEEDEKKKVENGEISSYEKWRYPYGEEIWYWRETKADYAYVDSNGNLISNIEFINKAKEYIEKKNQNIKYTKIIGDGVTFYILTESGEVYIATSAENGTWTYLLDKLNINASSDTLSYDPDHNMISKLNLREIVDIYDSGTALTKDGKIVSLIEDNDKVDSVVQELQSQTDKYLVVSHLGLKDGKLYNFDDVQQGVEVTAGKLVESYEAKFGIYSKSNKTVNLFDNKYEAEKGYKADDEIYIDVQKVDDVLPNFIDIAEYRNSYLSMIVPFYTKLDELAHERTVVIDYLEADPYALCYAISSGGEIWAYIGGYVVDTGINLDFFGPTISYALSNVEWTNQNIDLKYIENTTNQIESRNVKKDNNVISKNDLVTIEKNGEYSIDVIDSKGRKYQTTFNVVNIDKIKPVIETKGTIQNGVINLLAYDVKDNSGDYGLSGIANIKVTTEYPSENTEWTDLEILTNKNGVITCEYKEIEYGQKIYAIATDNAGNVSDVTEVELEVDNLEENQPIESYEDPKTEENPPIEQDISLKQDPEDELENQKITSLPYTGINMMIPFSLKVIIIFIVGVIFLYKKLLKRDN